VCDRVRTTTSGVRDELTALDIVVGVVPHTGIAANVRRVATEYGCYGELRPAPVGPDWLEGTNEGTETASTNRLTAAGRRAEIMLRNSHDFPAESHAESHGTRRFRLSVKIAVIHEPLYEMTTRTSARVLLLP